MSKQILTGFEAIKKLEMGVKKLTGAVKITLYTAHQIVEQKSFWPPYLL